MFGTFCFYEFMDTKRPTIPAAEEILGGYFPVLDYGFVSLVDYMGSDEDVERECCSQGGSSSVRGLGRDPAFSFE